MTETWLPELKPFLDSDIYTLASNHGFTDREAISLQLCREIQNLTKALHAK